MLRVKKEVLHTVDDRLFGQFFEKPVRPGEDGPESAVNEKGELPQALIDAVEYLQAPVLRFPGGSEMDYYDWRDKIDGPEELKHGRAVTTVEGKGCDGTSTNRFGYDEFLKMCEQIKSEPLIALNSGWAMFGVQTVEEGAQSAADLVEYINGTKGKFAELRRKNGREKPYNVKYWQIGNEMFVYFPKLKEQRGMTDEQIVDLHVRVVRAFVKAMRAVDPTIKIIVEGHLDRDFSTELNKRVMKMSEIYEGVNYVDIHYYYPWTFTEFIRHGKPIDSKDVDIDELWNAWAGSPLIDENGYSYLPLYTKDELMPHVRQVVLEWNCAGWSRAPEGYPVIKNLSHLKGISAAGYLNALMRAGDRVDIACQSMCLGRGWDLGAINYDSENPLNFFFRSAGLSTAMYSKFHGRSFFKCEIENEEYYEQPLKLNKMDEKKKVAYLDIVASGDDKTLYVAVINRSRTKSRALDIDLSALYSKGGQAVRHSILGDGTGIRDKKLGKSAPKMTVDIPAASINVVEIGIG